MEQYNLKEPKNLELHKLQDSINNSKRDYVLNQFNLEPKDSAKALAKVRLCADFFDIAALAIYKGLDKGYFLEGMGDYNKLKDKKGEILNRLYKLNPNIFGGE